MELKTDEDGNYWYVRLAPQRLTDILVQVVCVREDEDDVVFAFEIGELLLEEVEDNGRLDGTLAPNDTMAMNLMRWADQLEAYAMIVRSALRCRAPDPSERSAF